MNAPLTYEWIEQTALALLRITDAATGIPVSAVAALSAPGLGLMRKRSGDLVVLSAAGLDPVAGTSYPVDLRSTTGEYGPRRFQLHLPRDPDPANAATAGSLFQPALIPLLPGARYPANGNLGFLRVTVRRSTDNARVGGALIRVTPSLAGLAPARALTDIAGEALIVFPGVPVSGPGPGATVVSTFDASAVVLVDPLLANFTADDALDAARAKDATRRDGFLDPDDLETRLGAAPPAASPVQISAGRMTSARLAWTPP